MEEVRRLVLNQVQLNELGWIIAQCTFASKSNVAFIVTRFELANCIAIQWKQNPFLKLGKEDFDI